MNGKKIWKSKTFWVNLLSLVGIVYQSVTEDFILASPQTQASALAIINVILRAVTGEPIVWEEGRQKIKRG